MLNQQHETPHEEENELVDDLQQETVLAESTLAKHITLHAEVAAWHTGARYISLTNVNVNHQN